ncbi:MAG: hypothetical protein LH614_11875 [Pyrinomonadaceae bacterium]|nr:hypothetical protein [Pyrinomonadaceae bacterium]
MKRLNLNLENPPVWTFKVVMSRLLGSLKSDEKTLPELSSNPFSALNRMRPLPVRFD